ncbi:MAG: hypothetical protein KGZ79_09670 [Dethiobacter sp.]|jgi:hypothetical protein|nr:hypothetical protein [Dethiobacter sp.]MBS4022670.1 hypothetical protein [Dethiobacter sp.]
MKDRIDEMKKSYREVEVTLDLDRVIENAVLRGRKRLNRNVIQIRAAAAAVTVLVLLTAGINLSPAFADTAGSIPVLSSLVRILQFEKGKAAGGEITDGKQIGPVDWQQSGGSENILIPIYEEGAPSNTAAYFEVTYRQYPYSLTVELNGVRSLFAGEELPSFEDSTLVGAMYRIVTLDDSAQRFVITFKEPVEIEVKEMSGPAGILIEAKASIAENLPPVYSVRTASYDYGEHPGVLEGMLLAALDYKVDTVRMLRDSAGRHFAEAGYFLTESEAAAFREQILASGEVDFNLYIEQRGPGDTPDTINE